MNKPCPFGPGLSEEGEEDFCVLVRKALARDSCPLSSEDLLCLQFFSAGILLRLLLCLCLDCNLLSTRLPQDTLALVLFYWRQSDYCCVVMCPVPVLSSFREGFCCIINGYRRELRLQYCLLDLLYALANHVRRDASKHPEAAAEVARIFPKDQRQGTGGPLASPTTGEAVGFPVTLGRVVKVRHFRQAFAGGRVSLCCRGRTRLHRVAHSQPDTQPHSEW